MITYELLHELFDYDKKIGNLIWKNAPSNDHLNGGVAGVINSNGYRGIKINYKTYKAHRLIWCWHNKEMPTKNIDHINGIRDDNHIENLRLATRNENCQNLKKYRNNKSGHPGVSWHKGRGKWQVNLQYSNKNLYLGLYTDYEEASKAYLAAKAKYHTFNPTVRKEVRGEL